MAKETTYAGKLGDWQRLLDSLTVNAPQLAHLEGTRAVLASQLAQALKLSRSRWPPGPPSRSCRSNSRRW